MTWRLLANDLRFWIFIFFAVRLLSIDMPITDSHAWRQADGYAIARNFLEEDSNILYPRVDNRGDLSGITGSEFPILNYLVYLFYLVTGAQWFPGRLINLLVSSIGVWYFFKLIRTIISSKTAFTASMMLLASAWFGFSRKFMPDTFSCSLVLIGVYHFWEFITKKQKFLFALGVLFVSIGLLAKLSSFVLLAFLAPLMLRQKYRSSLLPIACGLVISFAAPLTWYFYWVPYLNEAFGISYFFMGQGLEDSALSLWNRKFEVFKHFYQNSLHYIGFAAALVGLWFTRFSTNKNLSHVILASSIFSAVYILKAGFNFAEHTYYIIPLVPFLALLAGNGLQHLKLKPLYIHLILAVIVIENVSSNFHEFTTKKSDLKYLQLEALLTEHSNPNDLVLTNGGVNPSTLYFMNRKGLSVPSWHFEDETQLQEHMGKTDILVWEKSRGELPSNCNKGKLLLENNNWIIIKTKKP